jgi:hypothetical protein
MKIEMCDTAEMLDVVQSIPEMLLPIAGAFVNAHEIQQASEIALRSPMPELNCFAVGISMRANSPEKWIARKTVQVEKTSSCTQESRFLGQGRG